MSVRRPHRRQLVGLFMRIEPAACVRFPWELASRYNWAGGDV